MIRTEVIIIHYNKENKHKMAFGKLITIIPQTPALLLHR